MSWTGRKRVAFIPTFRPRAIPPDVIPPDWANLILRRVLFDPAPNPGADRSFRAWLRAASSGLADINPEVLPMQTIDQQDAPPAVFEGQLDGRLRDEGFDHAAIVMLGDRPPGSNDGLGSRFVMAESTGVWVMEVMHGLTGFKDLYHFNNDLDPLDPAIDTFNEMSALSLAHPTACCTRWCVAHTFAPVGRPNPAMPSWSASCRSRVPRNREEIACSHHPNPSARVSCFEGHYSVHGDAIASHRRGSHRTGRVRRRGPLAGRAS